MLTLYKILTTVLYVALFPILIIPVLFGSVKWKNRLGFGHPHRNDKPLWIHASSVGEINVVGILIYYLRKVDPEISFYITVMTSTGFERACKLFGGQNVGFLPIDSAVSAGSIIRKINPISAVFIETEIWPCALSKCFRSGIPVFLANGRMSASSFKSYRKFKALFETILSKYSRLMVQTEADKERFLAIGAALERVEYMGNLKFDAPPVVLSDADRIILMQKTSSDENDKILILGSFRNDEFDTAVDICNGVRGKMRVIIVPRYMDKIDRLRSKLESANLFYGLYSQAEAGQKPDVVIVDMMGLLSKIYALGDIAVVGGTFDNVGGHNILEPVWAKTPVLYGPSVENVVESAKLIESYNYGRMVNSASQATEIIDKFIENKIMFNLKEDNSPANRALKTAKIILGRS